MQWEKVGQLFMFFTVVAKKMNSPHIQDQILLINKDLLNVGSCTHTMLIEVCEWAILALLGREVPLWKGEAQWRAPFDVALF